jgi:SRSO17 transposase
LTTPVFEEVTWRQGSKAGAAIGQGSLPHRAGTGRWTQPVGRGAAVAALLVEHPEGTDESPTGYWMTNLPATTPVADLVWWGKMRWRIEHDYRELNSASSFFSTRLTRG